MREPAFALSALAAEMLELLCPELEKWPEGEHGGTIQQGLLSWEGCQWRDSTLALNMTMCMDKGRLKSDLEFKPNSCSSADFSYLSFQFIRQYTSFSSKGNDVRLCHLMATEYCEVASGSENSQPPLLAKGVTPSLSGYLPTLTRCLQSLAATVAFWPCTLPRWFSSLDLWTPLLLSNVSGWLLLLERSV